VQIESLIRAIPDFPIPGILFRDITPLLARKELFREVVDLMSKVWSDRPPDLVAAIEARGFIPGAAIAVKLNAGFVPIRKTGKLPWKTIAEGYQLEYGTDQLEVHSDAVEVGQVRDDVGQHEPPVGGQLHERGELDRGVAAAVVAALDALVGEELDRRHAHVDPARREPDDDRRATRT